MPALAGPDQKRTETNWSAKHDTRHKLRATDNFHEHEVLLNV